MTAGEIVSNACKQAGLVEDGTTTSIVSTLGIGTLSIGGGLTAAAGTVPTTAAEIGLAILNRWYLYAWQRYPHRDIKIANADVSVASGAVAVDLPTEMDVIRSVRIAGGALLPLSEVREADFAAISGPTCWSEGYMNGQTIYTCSYGLGPYYAWGSFTLTRTDNPDIVTVTTNYVATGGGAVLRDHTNPDKFARLENGVFTVYEVVRTPAHWEFQGVACLPLTRPLTAFNGELAGYTWSTETSGEPPYQFYALYDESSMRKFASGPISGATDSLDFFRDEEPYDIVPMIYVGPSVSTNSL